MSTTTPPPAAAADTGAVTSVNPHAWAAAAGHDQGQLRRSPAAILTVSAQGPLDARGRLLHEDDVAAQLVLALANVAEVLAGAGLDLPDLAQLRVYTTDLDAVLGVYDALVEHLAGAGASPPATLVEVSRLPVPGMTVQIEALAIR